MATATIVTGPVTSGKTTVARRIVNNNPEMVRHIDLDQVEKALPHAVVKFSDGGATPAWVKQRAEVYFMGTVSAIDIIQAGYDVVISGAWPGELGFPTMLAVIADQHPAPDVIIYEMEAPTESEARKRWVTRGASVARFDALLRHAGGWTKHVRSSRVRDGIRQRYTVKRLRLEFRDDEVGQAVDHAEVGMVDEA